MKIRVLFALLVMAFLPASAALAQGNIGVRLGFEGFLNEDMGSGVNLDEGILGGDFEVFGGWRSLDGISVEFNTGVRYHRPDWQLAEEDFDEDLGSTNLFIVPFYVTARWRILQSFDRNAWVTPYIGGGAGGYYATFGEWETVESSDFDGHDDFDQTQFDNFGSQVAPGYHALAGVEFLANRRISVLAEFRYTYLVLDNIDLRGDIPISRTVDLDLSGWQIFFAMSVNLGELPGATAEE